MYYLKYYNGGPGSGIKGHKTPKPVKIYGRKKFKDYLEKSRYFRKVYKDKYQGSTAKTKYGKNVYLGQKGREETISKGEPALLSKIGELIEKAEPKSINEPLYKKRSDNAISFDTLRIQTNYNKVISNNLIIIRNKKEKDKITSDFYLAKKER